MARLAGICLDVGPRISRLAAALALTLLAGCANQVTAPSIPLEEARLLYQIPEEQAKELDVFTRYELAPGDVLDVLLQVQSWNVSEQFRLSVDDVVSIQFITSPELNQQQTIRPDGRVSLPFVGEKVVTGKTIAELTSELEQEYASVLWDPSLWVTVSNFRSRIDALREDLNTSSRGLSRLVTVRPDGYVTFPLLGSVYVAGRTIQEVNDELNSLYGGYLEGLAVDLFLERHAGSVVYVLGEVGQPGAYEMRRPITVLEAVTLAGGTTSTAMQSNLLILRREEDKVYVQRYNMAAAFTPNARFMVLQPDDMIFVPRTRLSTASEISTLLANVFQFRGISTGLDWEISDKPLFGFDAPLERQ